VRHLRLRRSCPLPPLLCRWDLDKTYLRSEFDTLRQLLRTARERGEEKVEVPGVPEVLKGLRAAADRHGRPFAAYFISASPPQIGAAIRDKLALDGVPYDGIVFKDQLERLRRGKLRQLREHVGFKLAELLRGRLAAAPESRELLFGDDWESDPLTYSLYADVIAGRLGGDRLKPLLERIGVDAELRPVVLALAGETAGGGGGVERIFINLERRTPPAVFRLLGARVVPTFNYFQTGAALAAEGYLDAEDLARVAGALIERAAFTPRRLENSLADLVRRGCLTSAAAAGVAAPLRRVAVLPRSSARVWLRGALARLRRRRAAGAAAPHVAIDYDTVLDALRPEGRRAGREVKLR
jgi:hypothetical protein